MRNVPPRSRCLANQISWESEIASAPRTRKRALAEWIRLLLLANDTNDRSRHYLFIYSARAFESCTYILSGTQTIRERCALLCVCICARARLDLYVWMCMHGDISAARERVRAHYVIRSHNAEPTIKWWDKTMGWKEKQQNLFVLLHAVMAPPQIIMGRILLYGNRLTDTTRVQTLIARQAI